MTKPPPPYFTWKQGFELGIPQVDAEHRQFLEMINELHAAMTRGDAEAQLRATHQKLLQYAAFHFEGEEEFLDAVGYPGLSLQRKQHAWFAKTIGELKLDSSESAREALALARDWMVQHILGTDRTYAAWLLEAPAAAKPPATP